MGSILSRENLGSPARRRALATLGVLALVLVPVSIAWACNPQAYLRISPSTVGPGTQMSISGAFFKPNAQLTFSFEPGGPAGSVTTSANGSFSTSITAPSNTGSYTLSAVGFESDGSVTNGLPARASFTVAPPGGAGSPPGGDSSGAVGGGSPPSASSPGAGRFAEPETPRARRVAPGRTSFGERQSGAGVRGGSGSAGAVEAGAGVIETAAGDVFASTVPRADRTSAASSGRAGAARDSRASALGEDVWTGFSSADAPSLLSDADDAVPAGDGGGSQLAWGVGLLALGLLSLVAGLTAMEVRKRRASQ